MKRDQFERVVNEAIAELPEEFRRKLRSSKIMPSLTEMVSILNGERRLQDGEFDLEMDALAGAGHANLMGFAVTARRVILDDVARM